MSQADQWSVIGRSKLDLSFGGQLAANFEEAIRKAGYSLTPQEIEAARRATQQTAAVPPPLPGIPDWPFQQEQAKERLTTQVKRMNDLGVYTVDILKTTLSNAAYTYKTITRMNTLMFFTGLLLFVAAALWSALAQDKIYSLVFGGLGAASFVTLFVLGPIDKTQKALSNLVQVEIAFMSYFEQISFWEAYALTPGGNPPNPDPANIERASAALQERSAETIELLQKYVEDDSSASHQRLRKPHKKGEAVEAS